MQVKICRWIFAQGVGLICLFAVTLAFLLPVAQDYREAARRRQCRNNLSRYAGLRPRDGNSSAIRQNEESSASRIQVLTTHQ